MVIVTNFARYGHITFFTMDISLFSRTIKELILENDRVGVPRLGHFVAEMMPASFSDRRTMINPPYRRMSFCKKDEVSVTERDLFLSKMEELSGLPLAEIADEYDIFIKGFISNLEIEKSVDVPSLGRMHATSKNEYFFVADEDLDIYPDGIGLEPVSVKAPDPDFVPVAPPEPVKETESEPVEVAVIDPETIEDNEAGVESEIEQESQPESEPVKVTVVDPETIEDNEAGVRPDNNRGTVRESESEYIQEPAPEPTVRRNNTCVWVTVIIVLLVIAVMLLIYIFKDSEWLSPILDKLLYTKEELRILGR